MEIKSRLNRRLGTMDAVVIGLGSMIGAGIFAAAGPAARAAGSGMLLGVAIAGLLALLNATTMAQLAAAYPESGGTYVYGRKLLGNLWGFMAGWGFVIGKLASCTAMALTFAYYAYPQNPKLFAIASVLIMTTVNYFGVKKSAIVTKVIVFCVLVSLIIVAVSALLGGAADSTRLLGWTKQGGVKGILESAGMMFFAFAGYARIATLGEEVINPRETIPRAIIIALFITLGIYFLIMTSVVLTVDVSILAGAKAPLALAVESGSWKTFSPVVRIGAVLASLGVLLSLMAGVSRTIFAMAANSDLPRSLSAIHPVHKVPHHAELLVGLIVTFIVALMDIRSAIGFSSFAILVYYAIANFSSLRLSKEERLWPKWMSLVGLGACIVIALSLPLSSIIWGMILFAVGGIYYYLKFWQRL